ILPYGTQLGPQQQQFSAFAYPVTPQQQQQQQQQQQPSGGFAFQSGQMGDSRAVVGAPQPGLPPQFFTISHPGHQHHPHHHPHQQPQQQPPLPLPLPPPQQLQPQQSSLDAMATSYDAFFRQQQHTILQAYEVPATYVMPRSNADVPNNASAGQSKQLLPQHSSSPTLAFTSAPSRQGSKTSLLSVTAPFTGFSE
ncbi:hypothetical protein GGF42_006932, partial [Coemansia sp. RSA 2424]